MSEHDDIANLFNSADSQTFFDDEGLVHQLSNYAIKQYVFHTDGYLTLLITIDYT